MYNIQIVEAIAGISYMYTYNNIQVVEAMSPPKKLGHQDWNVNLMCIIILSEDKFI